MANTSQTTQASATLSAISDYNSQNGTQWTLGENWNNVGTEFETFINKYLFPKLNETRVINIALGNTFDWLAREVDFIGQYSEDYVILDNVPIEMNLTKSEELMLKRNYPQMATKLYGAGIVKKQKFTLNNNDVRLNFLTLGDAVSYALAVYRKRLSDINVSEEREIKAMLVDYATSGNVKTEITATDNEDFVNQVFTELQNIQTNSDAYNEANTASGGTLGRYTTVTDLNDVAILTTTSMKTYLLNTFIANSFHVDGIDWSKKIIAFPDLGGAWKTTSDITISNADTVAKMNALGDYQTNIGDVVPEGYVFTWDVSGLSEFSGNVKEIKPDSSEFAYIFDIHKLNYKRYTKDMLKTPFYNGEFDEVTYWLHYYSFKSVSPFYNSVVITEA
jgi:hypothetical protein